MCRYALIEIAVGWLTQDRRTGIILYWLDYFSL